MQEASTKPYLIRALHEWCMDNGYTPHIVVTVDANTVVPAAHIHDGQITLNISPLATNRLAIGNDYIEFEARFSGATEHLFVPVAAVAAIYARETGAGMGFEVIESQPYPGGLDGGADAGPEPRRGPAPDGDGDDPQDPKPPRLKVVK
ncbi:ClpXP protease specificity-enhancing factor [Castellaniella sp. GW247-6E4]|uniref:ClpXP protease specificity-enhancing factor n=1 Tax=Castellaniella sp. GW247-6E4 TaxID=3140380 RepID=UPI003314CAB5